MCEEVVLTSNCSDDSDSDISDQYSFSSRSTTPTSEEEMADDPEAAEIATAGAATAGKELAEGEKRHTRVPGVVYLSRVPPFMKPHKLKHLLSPYGSVGRIYLQPEDDGVRKMRMKMGGNKKRNFTEGWVEFLDKRVAKAVAMALNNVHIGGKKKNYYHDDLWNIKYLPKFRWTHLTEKISYERAARDQHKRTEVAQAKRENRHYLASVDKRKEIAAIVERKKKRGVALQAVPQRCFKQRLVSHGGGRHNKEREGVRGTSSEHIQARLQFRDSLLKKILPV